MIIKNANVIFEDCMKISDVRVCKDVISEISENITPSDSETVLNLEGKILAPGFIDIHTHGAGGYDFGDGAESDILIERKMKIPTKNLFFINFCNASSVKNSSRN